MNRLTFLFILTTLLLGSCAPVTASPTQPVVDTVTLTVISSETPLPTPSAIPTITPYPPLHTQGPYLLFTRDNKSLTIMDADGSGRKQIQLPDDGYMKELKKSVSPDGNWIAYFTGSKNEPYNLALNLFNLEDETTFLIASLIASGFPENLEPVTRTLQFEEYDSDCALNIECKLNTVRLAFVDGIESLSWSPDSEFLAFTAQIDGPSSDIYTYDLDNRIIHRVTNELDNIYKIDWSPSGEKVLYETLQSKELFLKHALRLANPYHENSQNSKTLEEGAFWSGGGWLDASSFLLWDGIEGAPLHNFRYANIESEKVIEFWKYGSELFSPIPDLHGMALELSLGQVDHYQTSIGSGTYFVSLNGLSTKISDTIYIPISPQHGFIDSFLAYGDSGLYSLKIDGSSADLITKNVIYESIPQISPTKQWLLLETERGLELYSESLQLIKSWNFHNAEILWRTDSLGAFLISDAEMYYLAIPNGEPIWLSDCQSHDCPNFDNSAWLP